MMLEERVPKALDDAAQRTETLTGSALSATRDTVNPLRQPSAVMPPIMSFTPCIPCRQFELSKRFYLDLGFSIVHDSQKSAELCQGPCRFILQNYFGPGSAEQCMLQLIVPDAGAWWRALQDKQLEQRYDVRPPKLLAESNERVSVLLHDPSDVVWLIKQHVPIPSAAAGDSGRAG